MTKEELLKAHREYINWLDSLATLDEAKAKASYAEGKWSPNEIIMHLGEWDRFTLKQRLPNMKEGEKLEGFPDFETFNAKAAALAHEQTFKETLSYAKKQRQYIIEKLQQTDEIEWDKIFLIGNSETSIRSYFTDFLEHDEHHRKQVSSV
ncbi:DinB superfamily protein [Psychrobacillus sp. OK028]|uniref:DinB family protein n=1 Tax=Psychrobacillus sp. OK028 TaxID=1884359 RepID=UPI0008871F1E|nr:DinB family protein [Psychrobacillus sp. OK028]SDO27597.1 DinB superfamily protein [Psychrobacillus sp. OK028]